ncbi:Ras- protein Rab-18 [Kickxella alabastrina]|uniref:Ras- protein Rab-18 n=1 Tax=Kickxella alabastrina TaxID=61397 RepID=A0ACC1I1P6_9FUNG|nr:Ras- protein Rab-18 [Kickxella alabastrina]
MSNTQAAAAAAAVPEITATFKLLLIGDSNVGKSSILLRFTDDHFLPPEETSATIGVDFKVKYLEVDSQRYKLTIWDTAGQERFRTLTSSYYRGAQGVILVYDVSSRESFDNLDTWFEELKTYCSGEDVVKMVIGNKIDKESERQVSRKEGAEYARKHRTLFLECSAKTKIGVQQAMEELVNKIVETPGLWRKSSPSKGTVYVNDVPSGIAGGCAC